MTDEEWVPAEDDRVRLRHAWLEHGLRAGAVGTVRSVERLGPPPDGVPDIPAGERAGAAVVFDDAPDLCLDVGVAQIEPI